MGFKVGEVVIIAVAKNHPELVGEEATVESGISRVQLNNGSIIYGHRIYIRGDSMYKGNVLYAPPDWLRKKRPPESDWADSKVKQLLAGMKTPFAVRENHHATQGH